MDNLDDFLDGNEQPVEPIEAEQDAPEQPMEQETAPSGPERGADGKFKAKGDNEDAPPASDEKAKGLEAGIAAERRKRQELEQRIAEYERRVAELSKPKEPEAPPPSLWEDENAWQQHFGGQVASHAVEQATMQSRLQTSELLMLQNVEDFGAKKQEIFDFVGSNPAVNQEVASSPHPWKTAYEAFKKHSFAQELNATNMDDLKAQLLEQLKAEQAQAQEAARPNLPQSLAGEQSARGSATAPDNGPPSLKDIVG